MEGDVGKRGEERAPLARLLPAGWSPQPPPCPLCLWTLCGDSACEAPVRPACDKGCAKQPGLSLEGEGQRAGEPERRRPAGKHVLSSHRHHPGTEALTFLVLPLLLRGVFWAKRTCKREASEAAERWGSEDTGRDGAAGAGQRLDPISAFSWGPEKAVGGMGVGCGYGEGQVSWETAPHRGLK